MLIKRLIGAASIAAMVMLPLAASAAERGATGNTTGSVLVDRGGTVYSLSPNDKLFDGDKVVTREGATAILKVTGCADISLASKQTVTVGATGCPVVAAYTAPTLGAYEVAAASGGGFPAGTPGIIGAALAAGTAVGVVNNNNKSASP